MTSKERIRKILDLQRPDRIGMYDAFLDETIDRWKSDGFPHDAAPADYFDFDIDITGIEDILADNTSSYPGKDKYAVLAFSEPFQKLCDIMGREYTLRRLALYPKEVRERLVNLTYSLMNSIEGALAKGVLFDGVWVWGDVAYQKGLFFSPQWYRDNLLPLHRKIFRFVSSRGLSVFFHSDGDISEIIPDLLGAGVNAIHPLEESCGMDIRELIGKYRDDMVFVGHMDIEDAIRRGNFSTTLIEKICRPKESCHYIYCADYPIMPSVTRNDYEKAIRAVREAGVYCPASSRKVLSAGSRRAE